MLASCQKDMAILDVPSSYQEIDIQPESILVRCLNRLDSLEALSQNSQRFPRSWDEAKDQLIADPPHVWTVGFYPGMLWQAYNLTGDSNWRTKALKYLPALASQASNRSTHDLGFMLFLGLGKGELGEDQGIDSLLIAASHSLISRFNPQIGAIKSYDTTYETEFPVIIDNLINLELLLWAWRETGDSSYRLAVTQHAEFTKANFIQAGNPPSTYHKIIFNSQDSSVQEILPGQGTAPGSVWSRGLAWGIYGYTMLYRYLQDESYLKLAEGLASFWIEEVPEDGIPYWDFRAAHIPNEVRDASAAAIAASAFFELASYSVPKSKLIWGAGEKILKSLCAPTYFMPQGKPFMLDHATLSVPHDIDVDRPQTMADYYFMEALMRYHKGNRQRR